MNTNKTSLALTLFTTTLLVLAGCRKEPDGPPAVSIADGTTITLDSLIQLFNSGDLPDLDTTDWSVYATVTADETNGNLYKEVYVQDGDAALKLLLLNSGGLYQGDRIRIFLPKTDLHFDNDMLVLDSVDVDYNIAKQAVDVVVEPTLVTISDLGPSWQGRLIRLDSVEFIDGELGLTYADAVGQADMNRMLQDCSSDQIIVRTSGFANFAGLTVPNGRGNIIAVLDQYNSDLQLKIRDINEVQLNGPRCDGSSGGPCPAAASVVEDFAGVVQYDPIDINCWKNIATAGTVVWEGGTFSGTEFARAEAFSSGETANILWLVSPQVTYTSGTTLSFITEKAYWSSDPFAVLISTDFDGLSIGSGTWTAITATHATGADADYTWVPSGNIDLAPYLPVGYTGTFYIAFRYTGGDPSNTTRYDIDDVQIQ